MTLIRRLPKRGFNHASKTIFVTVSVAQLDRFDAGSEVTPATLFAAGLLSKPGETVKILSDGEISKKLAVKAHGFSAAAKAKIEAKGGSCEVVK